MHITQIIPPFAGVLILINKMILGTWKMGIRLVYTACITIIISPACVDVTHCYAAEM